MGDLTRHFSKKEFACKCGCGADHIDPDFVNILEKIREECVLPIVINSGVRCRVHNLAEGGKNDSAHVFGKAADIKCYSSMDRFNFVKLAIKHGITRIGIAKGFVHLDIDDKKPQNVIWLY